MRILALTLAVATGLAAGSTWAADLPSREAPPAVYAPPVFTWTGFYVGVHAGYAWGDGTARLTGGPDAITTAGFGDFPFSASLDPDGFVGGAQIGYNYQIDQFVIGVEADIAYADVSGSSGYTFARFTGDIPFNSTSAFKQDLDWLGTVRLRLGFALDRALIYATGGFAFGGLDNRWSYEDNYGYFGRGANDDVATGWTIGGGLEYAFTDNITAKAEYLYYDLGDKNVSGLIDDMPVTYKFDHNGSIVRVGLNYKFTTY